MNIKNARYSSQDKLSVDVEVEHPNYGWIPYTFKTNEPDTSYDSDIRQWLQSATILPYEDIEARPKTQEQILADKLFDAQLLLDTTEFKFNDDYDLKDTPEWLELKAKRQEAREFIRANS